MTTVQDGIKREPSANPDVHRELVVVDPPLGGRDVANLNKAVKARLDARGLEIPTPTHSLFTHAAAVAAVEAGYFLGALSDTYLRTVKVNGDRRLVCSEGMQRLIRDPRRSDEQLARAKERQGQLERGPRYYEDLAREGGIKADGKKGADAALDFAKQQIGTREQPPGSNWGPKIGIWIRAAGYTSPVPWCGCFANACVMAAGVPSGAGWIGYTPAIIAHAKAGKGGWSWHGPSEGQRGDLALFDTPGGDPAVHVEEVEERRSATAYGCIGGNTTPKGMTGSGADGGMVGRTDRSTQGNFRIVGFARPPWPK